jgi:hypothetical protein
MLALSDRSASMKTRAMKLLDAKQEEALRYFRMIVKKKGQAEIYRLLDHLVKCHFAISAVSPTS